jgi:hypothetical protein
MNSNENNGNNEMREIMSVILRAKMIMKEK